MRGGTWQGSGLKCTHTSAPRAWATPLALGLHPSVAVASSLTHVWPAGAYLQTVNLCAWWPHSEGLPVRGLAMLRPHSGLGPPNNRYLPVVRDHT